MAVKAAAEDLKSMALGVTEELEAAPVISKSKASRSTMKKTVKLYEKARAACGRSGMLLRISHEVFPLTQLT